MIYRGRNIRMSAQFFFRKKNYEQEDSGTCCKKKTLKLRIQYSVMMSFENKYDHYILTEWLKSDNTNVQKKM